MKSRNALLILLSLFVLNSCTDNDEDTSGGSSILSATSSPSPSPSSLADTNSVCYHAYSDLRGDNYVAGLGPKQIYELKLTPYNKANSPLGNDCDYPKTAGWNIRGGPCKQVDRLNALFFRYYCIAPGELDLIVTHGPYTIAYTVVIAENRKVVILFRGMEIK